MHFTFFFVIMIKVSVTTVYHFNLFAMCHNFLVPDKRRLLQYV